MAANRKLALALDLANMELRNIDNVLARRPALEDLRDRYAKVERACTMAGRAEKAEAERDVLRDALQGIIEIGKRDLSNPKYDGYFESARAALARKGVPDANRLEIRAN
jgi:hypothetical protein